MNKISGYIIILCEISLLIFLLFQCDNQDPCQNYTCQLSDTSIIGKWKLVEECACYTLGGDFKWRETSMDLTLTFNEQCVVIQGGNESSTCKQGKYTINPQQLNLKFICPGGSTVNTAYQYTFSPNKDTLIVKNFVDEGFFGSKYYKQ